VRIAIVLSTFLCLGSTWVFADDPKQSDSSRRAFHATARCAESLADMANLSGNREEELEYRKTGKLGLRQLIRDQGQNPTAGSFSELEETSKETAQATWGDILRSQMAIHNMDVLFYGDSSRRALAKRDFSTLERLRSPSLAARTEGNGVALPLSIHRFRYRIQKELREEAESLIREIEFGVRELGPDFIPPWGQDIITAYVRMNQDRAFLRPTRERLNHLIQLKLRESKAYIWVHHSAEILGKSQEAFNAAVQRFVFRMVWASTESQEGNFAPTDIYTRKLRTEENIVDLVDRRILPQEMRDLLRVEEGAFERAVTELRTRVTMPKKLSLSVEARVTFKALIEALDELEQEIPQNEKEQAIEGLEIQQRIQQENPDQKVFPPGVRVPADTTYDQLQFYPEVTQFDRQLEDLSVKVQAGLRMIEDEKRFERGLYGQWNSIDGVEHRRRLKESFKRCLEPIWNDPKLYGEINAFIENMAVTLYDLQHREQELVKAQQDLSRFRKGADAARILVERIVQPYGVRTHVTDSVLIEGWVRELPVDLRGLAYQLIQGKKRYYDPFLHDWFYIETEQNVGKMFNTLQRVEREQTLASQLFVKDLKANTWANAEIHYLRALRDSIEDQLSGKRWEKVLKLAEESQRIALRRGLSDLADYVGADSPTAEVLRNVLGKADEQVEQERKKEKPKGEAPADSSSESTSPASPEEEKDRETKWISKLLATWDSRVLGPKPGEEPLGSESHNPQPSDNSQDWARYGIPVPVAEPIPDAALKDPYLLLTAMLKRQDIYASETFNHNIRIRYNLNQALTTAGELSEKKTRAAFQKYHDELRRDYDKRSQILWGYFQKFHRSFQEAQYHKLAMQGESTSDAHKQADRLLIREMIPYEGLVWLLLNSESSTNQSFYLDLEAHLLKQGIDPDRSEVGNRMPAAPKSGSVFKQRAFIAAASTAAILASYPILRWLSIFIFGE